MGADRKAIARKVFDVVCRGDMAVADEILASDVVFTTVSGAVLRGRSEFKHFAEAFRSAFPDISFQLEAEVCEGDLVSARYLMRGTFLGTLMGLLPTGNEFSVRGIDTFRVVDGKVVEIYASFDTLGQMQQLGIVPKL
ncbi:MAG: ester cyclase [Candidatus Limnocylindria bacterium]|nr:ester cyclase [Candidatus Limnocylindria bacterium]